MLALKDLESIKNLATVLVIPFFAAACVADGAMQAISNPALDWLRNHESAAIHSLGWAVLLLLVVALVAFAVIAFDWAVLWLHHRLGEAFVMPGIALACITAGIFVLTFVMPELPKSPLNPLWHISFLCYGFSLLERATK